MIKNEKQYRITKAQAGRFEHSLEELARQRRPANVTLRLWRAQREAAESQLQDLREQMEAYERLHFGKSKELTLAAVEDLPRTLIRARIASGLTQEGLASRMGVKTQQIQRYEATEYQSASFARIRKVVEALGLRISKPVRLIRSGPQSANLRP
jgi:ribosome-binding protein aMBF1 (putative translation factor)